ncbi:MAG: TonB-dependent receptor [Deltaproteobacteria bacterium]|nr:TonB-dependent receptor [Deltaproteobacteria bacterium]
MKKIALLLILLSLPSPVSAGEGEDEPALRYEMEELVITASKTEQTAGEVPGNVTVISRQDIEDSASDSVSALLSREEGVTIRSPLGNDRQAAVDIRGMGDTAASNVVVMVDGVRRNFADLRGADLSLVSLDQVESLEIVRGAGSVLYGSGAVGGVVNIITKRPDGPPRVRTSTSYGSFGTLDARVSSDGRTKKWAYGATAGYYDSDGFRDNGYLRKKDAAAKISRRLGDCLVLDARGSWYEADQGLPGAVPAAWAYDPDLRDGTRNPNDFSHTEDVSASLGAEADLGPWGTLKVKRSYRVRDDSYIIGFSPLVPGEDQTDTIEENSRFLDASWRLSRVVGGLDQSLTLGLDHRKTDYIRQENSRNRRSNADVETLGLYALANISPARVLTLRAGGRTDVQEVTFRDDALKDFGGVPYWVNGPEATRDFDNTAWEAGVVWSPADWSELYFNGATSFRVPNVDELAFAAGTLESQTSRHLDAGVRLRLGSWVETSVTVFDIHTEDEIFFDQSLQANRNFEDDTLRRGVEARVRAWPASGLSIWANATILRATFENQDEATIPLVPEQTASAGVEYAPRPEWLLTAYADWVGERYDGNDMDNTRYEKLDSYLTAGAGVQYRADNLSAFVGVNNIFDQEYSSLAYSEAHYPMPGRSFRGGVTWTFP